MKLYKMLTKTFLAECADALRKHRNMTQDEMAEKLRITSRAYGDLERGKFCFSTISFLFLLLMLSAEEVNSLLSGFRRRVQTFEQNGTV